jgi:DNA polymerase III sliding clamp (beta) subunit (PCNA family)
VGILKEDCMEIRLNRDALKEAVGVIRKITRGSENAIGVPVLGYIFVTASNKSDITLAGSDSDTTIELELTGKVKKDGSVLIHGKKLWEAINSLKDEDLIIKTSGEGKDQKIFVGYTQLQAGYDVGEWVKMIKIKPSDKLSSVATSKIKEGFNNVIYAVSKKENNPALNSVYIDVDKTGSNVSFVATDVHRMSVWKAPEPVKIEAIVHGEGIKDLDGNIRYGVRVDKSAIYSFLQIKNANQITKVGVISRNNLDKGEEKSGETDYTKNYLIISGKAENFSYSIFAAEKYDYPDYKSVIPKEDGKIKISMPKKDFTLLIHALSAIRGSKFSNSNVYLYPAKNMAFAEADDVKLNVPVKDMTIDGEWTIFDTKTKEYKKLDLKDFAVCYNINFLADCGDLMNEHGNITFLMNGNHDPTVVKIEGREDLLTIIMPMFFTDAELKKRIA